MTQYFDKYGTEIFDGDLLRSDMGKELTQVSERVTNASVFPKYWMVLSRADGTQVYRYTDNRDVRLLDVVRTHVGEDEGVVRAIDGDGLLWLDDRSVYPHACTLIRRAEEKKTEALTTEWIKFTAVDWGFKEAETIVWDPGHTSPPPKQPPLYESLGLFRAMVEKVLAKEAPIARAVCDVARGKYFMAHVDLGGFTSATYQESEINKDEFRRWLRNGIRVAGARALGKK